MRRLRWRALGWFGWAFCELAFAGDCWGLFALAYRVGCTFYGWETDFGERWGFLVQNPKFGQPDEPQLIEAS